MELPTEYDEVHWLFVIRITGYILSTVVLLIFICIVFTSAYLWEQFHILRLNLTISIIVGNAAVLLGELEMFQQDRHACTVLGCLINFAYTASAFLLACEGHACFKVILVMFIMRHVLGLFNAFFGISWT